MGRSSGGPGLSEAGVRPGDGATLVDTALGYWARKRGARPMPARADLDPAEMRPLLPYIMLLDVLREPLDFRYRLVGTGIVARYWRDYTGLRLGEIAHQGPSSWLWADLCAVVEARRPVEGDRRYDGPDERVRSVRAAMLPLSSDAIAVDKILGVLEFELHSPPSRATLRGLLDRP